MLDYEGLKQQAFCIETARNKAFSLHLSSFHIRGGGTWLAIANSNYGVISNCSRIKAPLAFAMTGPDFESVTPLKAKKVCLQGHRRTFEVIRL